MYAPIRLCLTLATSVIFLLVGCGSAPQAQRGFGSGSYPSARLSAGQAEDVTIYAMGLVGTPYRYGGNTPESGFDCSGLIGHVYRTRAEIVPPRTVAKLNGWGFAVSRGDLQSGDLVLFAQNDSVAHAGIYVGGNRFVHAPSTGGEVRLDSLNSKYWSAQRATFRRP